MSENKTFSVQVSTTSAKKIGVSSNVSENPITATSDTGLYYSQLAKNWAIGEGLIENTDYSSKAYAQESKAYALDSKAYSETARLDLENLDNKIIEYEEQLNDTVATGLSEISVLQADSLAEIEANKISALSSIETNLNNATSEINTNRTNTLAQISTLANTSISDINAVGKSYDNITHKNITNCLLEVPQRIKYTLENGTLTVKAGSVVIVPYGTEDLTAQYPKGATFLNDNFRVYDTQYADGKFFVWAELLTDISSFQDTTISQNKIITIQLTTATVRSSNNGESGTSENSNANWTAYYNTSTNFVGYSGSTTSVVYDEKLSFPILLGKSSTTTMYSEITQVFNGIGYIGSTVWVDKGVKGLLPNGRNEDGSLKNVEWTNDKIRTSSGLATGAFDLVYKLNTDVFEMNKLANWSFNEDKNIYVYRDGTEYTLITLGRISLNTGTIIAFNPKQPFRAVDSNEFTNLLQNNSKLFDGQVTYPNRVTIFNTTTVGTYTVDLSAYVPNDGCGYDLYIAASTGAGSDADGNDRNMYIYDATGVTLAMFLNDAASKQITSNAVIPLLPSTRAINIQLASTNNATFSRAIVYLNAVRRRGTNA